MCAVGWHPSFLLPFPMAGAHLASSNTLSRWWPFLCSCFSNSLPRHQVPVFRWESACRKRVAWVCHLPLWSTAGAIVKQGPWPEEREGRQAVIGCMKIGNEQDGKTGCTYLRDFGKWPELVDFVFSSLKWKCWTVLLTFHNLVTIWWMCFRSLCARSSLCYSDDSIMASQQFGGGINKFQIHVGR